MRLNGLFRPLFIGTLDTKAGVFRTRRSESDHVHHNSRSICLNAELLHSTEINYRWIEVTLIQNDGREEKLITTRAFFLTHGLPISFKKAEPQVALPIELWGKERAIQYEREKRSQGDLFEAAA